MNQGERVKKIRKALNLTLEKFGAKLGVSKSAVSNIESGSRGLTEQMIRSICREYQVSEEWLRNGNGEIFQNLSRREKIATFLGTLMNEDENSYKVRLIEALADLDYEEWTMLEKIASAMIKNNA